MLRISRLTVLGVVLGLAALIGCAGGETGEEAAATIGTPETAESPATEQQAEIELPEGVTAEMVDQGREIFAGAGLCYVCHGAEGVGMPGLGADLTDDEWVQGDGSYEGIIQTVMNGVPSEQSTTGTPMSERGGSGITDDQVRAVAAYVYTLSRGGT